MEAARSTSEPARSTARRLALVLLGAVDRRMLPALTLVPQLARCEARALHISVDPAAAHDLARAWMDLDLHWLPLHIEEPTGPTLAGTVRDVVGRELRARPGVTVIVPEMDLGRWWQPLLHRSAGREIAWHLHGLRRVTTVVLPVRLDLGA